MTFRISVVLAATTAMAGCATVVDPNAPQLLEFQKPGVSREAMKRDSAACWAMANKMDVKAPSVAQGVAQTAIIDGPVLALVAGIAGSNIAANAHKPYSIERVPHHNDCMWKKGYTPGW